MISTPNDKEPEAVKTLPNTVRPAPSGRSETTDGLPANAKADDAFDAGLMRHVHLLTTAPMVRHQNQLWTLKWELVRSLAQDGPQKVSVLVKDDDAEGEAALDALVNEGLVGVTDESDDARSRIVTVTQRGKTVLDTIRPPI